MHSSPSSSPEIVPQPSHPIMAPDPEPLPSTLRASYKDLSFEGMMEDLSSRFILNLPEDEMRSVERICFQVEQAHWFYEDFVRDDNKNRFPSYALKTFSNKLFQACPILHQWRDDHEAAFSRFMDYKVRVPVCGAIMLNDTWDKCVLVKGWKTSSGWGFPKGKINEDEEPHLCAVREVLEETGYNLRDQINPAHLLVSTAREQHTSLYIVPNVSEDFPFATRTRKEISKIEWFKLNDLPGYKRKATTTPPGKFFLINPFINGLRSFVSEHKPVGLRKGKKGKTSSDPPVPVTPAPQESSPQTSSAENGDPQTPSPHYSDPVVHIDSQEPNEMMTSIDPHFASLLNSLTMSAAPSVLKSASRPAVNGSRPEPSRAPSVRAPSTTERPASRMSTTTTITQGVRPASTLSALSVAPGVPGDSMSSSLEYPPTPHSAASTHASIATHSTGNSGQSCVPSRRGQTSRRSSSTADISPYLSRPMEAAPVSGKRLKQLALLEGLANESARMSPLLRAGSTVPTSASPMYHHGLPMSSSPVYNSQGNYAPPSPFAVVPHPNDRILYSSTPGFGPGLVAPPPAIPHSFNHQPIHDDAFQVRPRTSHQFQGVPMYPPSQARSTMNRASMNQAQLMSLIHPPPSIRAHPPQPQPYIQYPPPNTAHTGPPGPHYPMAPGMHPVARRVGDGALLSILNGPVKAPVQ